MKAWLEGQQLDLEDLANLLPSGDVRVVREGDAYCLTAPSIDNPPGATTFYEAAQDLLNHVNGLARLQNTSFQPVGLSGKYTDGESQHTVISPRSAECRTGMGTPSVTVTRPDGTIVPAPPSPWPGRLAVAETNSDVADVFEIMSSTKPVGWDDLFKVHEIVGRSVEPTTIVKLGWTTSNKDSTFTSSANNPAVSGSGARHARPPKGNHPNRKMSIAEAVPAGTPRPLHRTRTAPGSGSDQLAVHNTVTLKRGA